MIFQVFKATSDKSVKNDFVYTCKKYLEKININMSFEEVKNMSDFRFKKLSKEKMKIAAFEYLKTQQNKQDKIKNIEYEKFEMQDYLPEGDRNNEVSKDIFEARGMTLDLKLHKRWKYEDTLCTGCKVNEE